MKTKIIILAMLLVNVVFAQRTEFATYPNGLIYSESTMEKLSVIADSLSLRFRTCDLDKTFYSIPQGVGTIIKLKKGDIKSAKNDIDNSIGIESFLMKYTEAESREDILVVKYSYKDYEENDIIEFSEISLTDDYGTKIKINRNELQSIGNNSPWVYKYKEKSEYSDESITAFYFSKKMESRPLIEKYTRMVGYADCLIDTTVLKFKEDAKRGSINMPINWEELSIGEKRNLLDEFRSTRVVGTCSQDDRPRVHAMNIAVLSAETANWETFLRSHLDIMNDRFDRISDGSYALGTRKTYINELEELNINIIDLIIGVSLRIENPAKNHYFGSIRRIGRALSETKNKKEMEDGILSIIENNSLDDFNRVIGYFLFSNYIHYIEDEEIKAKKVEYLKTSLDELPDYLKKKIELKDK